MHLGAMLDGTLMVCIDVLDVDQDGARSCGPSAGRCGDDRGVFESELDAVVANSEPFHEAKRPGEPLGSLVDIWVRDLGDDDARWH
jgi:hypothetical protein